MLKSLSDRGLSYTCIANSQRLSLLVSGDGRRVLVASFTGQIFLWECLVPQDLNSVRDSTVKGCWSQITSSENSSLPSAKDKEACLHCVFVQSQVRATKVWLFYSIHKNAYNGPSVYLFKISPVYFFCAPIQTAGDMCLSAFVFTVGEQLIVTFLKIQWEETGKTRLDSI